VRILPPILVPASDPQGRGNGNRSYEPALFVPTQLAGEYRLSASVLFFGAPDGTARLLDFDHQFYAIDHIGAELLRATLEDGTAAAVSAISSSYGVERERVCADLEDLLTIMRSKGLLITREHENPKRTRSRALQILFAVAGLKLAGWGVSPLRFKARSLLLAARLSFRLLGWRQTIDLWDQRIPLASDLHTAGNYQETVQRVEAAVRSATARALFGATCKESALSAWALCRALGVPATLVVGVSLYPLTSHCWVEVGSSILTDFRDRCELFTPVLHYG